jgi:hypothetical protein
MEIVIFAAVAVAATGGFVLAFVVPIRAFGNIAGFRAGVFIGSVFALTASLLMATVIAGHLSVAGPVGIMVGLFLGCFLGAVIINLVAGGLGVAVIKLVRRPPR